MKRNFILCSGQPWLTINLTLGIAFALSLMIAFTVGCTGKEQAKTPSIQPEKPKMIEIEASTISKINGNVEILKSGESEWKKANEKDAVMVGDKIRTGDASSIDVTVRNQTGVRLKDSSEISIDERSEKQDTLKLWSGKIVAKVHKANNSGFNIMTPTAVCGVRGTMFYVEYSKLRRTKVAVLEGKVAVATKENPEKTIDVLENEKIELEPLKLPNIKLKITEREMNVLKEANEIVITKLTRISTPEINELSSHATHGGESADYPKTQDESITASGPEKTPLSEEVSKRAGETKKVGMANAPALEEETATRDDTRKEKLKTEPKRINEEKFTTSGRKKETKSGREQDVEIASKTPSSSFKSSSEKGTIAEESTPKPAEKIKADLIERKKEKIILVEKDNWAVFTTKDGIPSDKINCITADGNNVWIGTDKGIGVYNKKSGICKIADMNLSGRDVRSMISDGDFLWVATTNGLNCYNKDNGNITFHNKNSGLPDNNVMCIVKDGNSIWVGTQQGACRIDKKSGKAIAKITTREGLGNDVVCAIGVEKNYVWFGTYQGGVTRYDKLTGACKTYNKSSGLTENKIRAILVDGNDVWFGTDGGGTILYNKKSNAWKNFMSDNNTNNYVWSITKAEDKIWFASYKGGISSYAKKDEKWTNYSSKTGLVKDDVKSVFSDGGDIWIGTSGGGLSRYNRSTEVRTVEE